MPKRYNNTIHKLFFKSKTTKAILSSIIRIRPIIYIEDPKETFGVDHAYIKKDIKIKETTVADIVTTIYFIRSNTISIINLNTS